MIILGTQGAFCTVTFNGEEQKTTTRQPGSRHPEWNEELRFTLFEDIKDRFGRPADGGGPPPLLSPENPKSRPSIADGKLLHIACFVETGNHPVLIGGFTRSSTEVLTPGEIDCAFIQVPVLAFTSLMNPQ